MWGRSTLAGRGWVSRWRDKNKLETNVLTQKGREWRVCSIMYGLRQTKVVGGGGEVWLGGR